MPKIFYMEIKMAYAKAFLYDDKKDVCQNFFI